MAKVWSFSLIQIHSQLKRYAIVRLSIFPSQKDKSRVFLQA